MDWENKNANHGEGVYHQQSGTYFRPRKFEDFWNEDESYGECDFEVDYVKLSVGFPALGVQRTENEHPDLSILSSNLSRSQGHVLSYAINRSKKTLVARTRRNTPKFASLLNLTLTYK